MPAPLHPPTMKRLSYPSSSSSAPLAPLADYASDYSHESSEEFTDDDVTDDEDEGGGGGYHPRRSSGPAIAMKKEYTEMREQMYQVRN